MDIEKLIERLRSYTYWLGQDGPESHDIHPLICDEAADAISTIPTLQAENEKLIAANNAVARDNAQLNAENAQLRAELEQVKQKLDTAEKCVAIVEKQRDAAIKQIEKYMVQEVLDGNEPCDICAKANTIPCEGCDPKWRGPEEG